MDFYEAIERRRTVRDFSGAPIDDESVRRIIAAGMKAPTNDHMRDWQFIVIKEKAVIRELIAGIPKGVSDAEVDAVLRGWNLNDPCQQAAYRNAIPKQYRMLAEAACVIIPVFKQKVDLMHPENLSHLNGFASIWCCIENMFLAAVAEGYASALRVPLGDEGERAREVLHFPVDYVMPCFIAVGKPAADADSITQIEHSLDDVIHWNNW